MASTAGRSRSTRRGVNARLTNDRIRVWSGGFRNSSERGPSGLRARDDASSEGASSPGSGLPSLESRSAARQSSKRVRIQKSDKPVLCTGDVSPQLPQQRVRIGNHVPGR